MTTPQLISYGTVRDYCDSCGKYPQLSHLQRDLKDLQRPSALKRILALTRPGASLLEIGAGLPHVASMLSQLGYQVTIVDPYDGSGNGSADYAAVKADYPDLQIVRDRLAPETPELSAASFDCVYSISVLEHVHEPALSGLFAGIKRFLKPGGYSLHLIDHVLAGEAAEFHRQHLEAVIGLQASLTGEPRDEAVGALGRTLAALVADIDTYYLSAEGHNLWRGATPYDQFPFRKVVSVDTLAVHAVPFAD